MSGFWDVIVPEATENLVLNPIGGDTDNIAAASATVTVLDTTYGYLGAYDVRVQSSGDNEGVRYTLKALTNAIHYVTVRVRGTIPTWDWSLDGSTYSAPSLLGYEGPWAVYGYQFPAAQANASTRLDLYQNGAGSGDYYLGHVQVEAKSYATTPVTGDLPGCYWSGADNASTSVRPAWVRSGGRVYDLDDQYGMYLAQFVDIGAVDLERYEMDLALLPGSLDEGHKVLPRDFVLVGEQSGTTWKGMHKKRKDLLAVIMPDLVKGDQPTTFRYKGASSDNPMDIQCYYVDGMGFGDYEGFVSKQSLVLHANDPYFYDPYDTFAHLTISQNVANSAAVLGRVDGNWQILSTDFNNTAFAIEKDFDNQLYIGGNFTNVGDANGDGVVKYNPSDGALTSLSTGTGGVVLALLAIPNNDVFIGGTFAALGDSDGADLTRWDGSAFNSLSTGMSSSTDAVYAFAYGVDNNVYIGGSFNAIGDTDGNNIILWNGASVASVGTGTVGAVRGLAAHPDGDIYAVGTFTSAGGDTDCIGVARWDGSAWNPLGTGLSGGAAAAYGIAISDAGDVYIGGNFTAADGVSTSNIAIWNGNNFSTLGSGCNDVVRTIFIDDISGLIYVGGAFQTAGGLTIADQMAVWNGTTWAHIDVNLPSVPETYGFEKVRDNLYVVYDGLSGTAVTSYVNSVTNNGSAKAYPIFATKCSSKDSTGSAVIKYLENVTTGAKIWLNYSLASGEQLNIDFAPQSSEVYSTFFGKRWDAILRGSDVADFYLLPGVNQVSVFVDTTSDASVTSVFQWRNAYDSADGAST